MPFGVHPVLHRLFSVKETAFRRVTNAFRRSPRSPQLKHTNAYEAEPSVTNAFRRSPRSPQAKPSSKAACALASPMPFGVHPVLHIPVEKQADWRTVVTNAFRRSPRSPPNWRLSLLRFAWSPMPFGVHPVLHSTFVTRCGARAQVFFRL